MEEAELNVSVNKQHQEEKRKEDSDEKEIISDPGGRFENLPMGPEDSAKDKPVSYVNSSFTFPQKLFHLLENSKFGHLVAWRSHGLSFQIFDEERFMEEVAPYYFKQKKWPSFQRQLNIYGFKKNHRGVDSGCYFHPFFQRGNNDMIFQIKRMPEKGTLASYEEVTSGPAISQHKKKIQHTTSEKSTVSSSSSSTDIHSSESDGSRKFPFSQYPFPYYMAQGYPTSPSSPMHANQSPLGYPMIYPPYNTANFSTNSASPTPAYLPYPMISNNFPGFPYPMAQSSGFSFPSQSPSISPPSAMYPYSMNPPSIPPGQNSMLAYPSYFPFSGVGHNGNATHSFPIPFPTHRSVTYTDLMMRHGQGQEVETPVTQTTKEDSDEDAEE